MSKDNKVFDALDKTFDTVTKELKVKTPTIQPGQNLEDDFEEARMVLKRAMAYSESTIQGILGVAQNSDNPRAYEVAAQAIKTLGDQALQAMEIQDKKVKIDNTEGKKKQQQIGTQNNIVFNGSTSDLLKAIQKENNKVIEHESKDGD
tara:strand:- start:136 stop:579 length:444 start_codon:yes stop_codon:yes gene_type:complete